MALPTWTAPVYVAVDSVWSPDKCGRSRVEDQQELWWNYSKFHFSTLL